MSSASTASRSPRPGPSARGRTLALVALLAIPWSVQLFSARDATFLFAWGLVNTNPPMLTTLPDFLLVYTRGLPEFILAWPLSVLLYALALASAAIGWRTGREDPRVTAGLLVVAGVAQFQLAWGFSYQPYRTALPIGTVAFLAVTWWGYWPALRSAWRRGDDE